MDAEIAELRLQLERAQQALMEREKLATLGSLGVSRWVFNRALCSYRSASTGRCARQRCAQSARRRTPGSRR